MSLQASQEAERSLEEAIGSLEIALPSPNESLEQDEEWVVVRSERGWRKIRLHDYGDVFAVQGLYEKWVYEILGCRSPMEVRRFFGETLRDEGVDPGSLVALDLGAGNGIVAEELSKIGITRWVGVDIYEQAAKGAERDRPGLYDDFVVGDLTRLSEEQSRKLDRHTFTCLTCVAALGFGDIPPEVFGTAYNHVEDGGWIAFTIKEDFVGARDKSGFSALLERMVETGVMEIARREPYVHRVTADGQELIYHAFIGRKRRDIPGGWIASNDG